MIHTRLTLLLSACLLALSMSGCGSVSPTAPHASDSWPGGAEVESRSFQLLNQARSQNGVSPLRLDAELSAIARKHSEHMRDEGFFGHVDPEGHNFVFRVQSAGVSFAAVAENIARTTDSAAPADLAHRLFLRNEAHRENMLNPIFTEVGVGVAIQGHTYWITQLYLEP